MILFAIFKNGLFKGNERANNGIQAIRNYIIASNLSDFLNDSEFLKQYTFVQAVDGIHYNERIVESLV